MFNMPCCCCPIMFYRSYTNYMPEFINNMNYDNYDLRDTYDDLLPIPGNPIIGIENNDEEDTINDANDARYLNAFRASQDDISRIANLLISSGSYVYSELVKYGVNKNTANYLFRQIIGFVLDNAERYAGAQIQAINGLLKDFENRYPSILSSFVNIPYTKLIEIVRSVIEFTLKNMLA